MQTCCPPSIARLISTLTLFNSRNQQTMLLMQEQVALKDRSSLGKSTEEMIFLFDLCQLGFLKCSFLCIIYRLRN